MVDWIGILALTLAATQLSPVEPQKIVLKYKGKVVVEGGQGQATLDTKSEPAQPVYLGYPHGPKTSEFVPKGAVRETLVVKMPSAGATKLKINASADSMPCDAHDDAVVGSAYGVVSDRKFNAIYDRAQDWLLVFSPDVAKITPTKGGYIVDATGPMTITFKPDYIKNHLGYFLWKPTHALWKPSVAGWCSWMAHLQNVTEQDMLDASRFFSENLKDYGYDVIQMDDGFQRTPQSGDIPLKPGEKFSEMWTKPNAKFPSGLESLAHQIQGMGMTPGIWVGFYLPLGLKNADGYVTDPDGKPHRGPWVNYAVNGLMPKAVDEAYTESIRVLKAQGWRYFKIDTLRHVLYDNYRQTPAYWQKRGESMEQAYRAIYAAVKKEAGPNIYALACWGTLPELAGIPDGCRIGEDVSPDIASMRRAAKYISQFHHLNDIVWRNDPDYMCLRVPVEQARAWASLTAMAGGHVMVSDPIKDYDAERVEILRKVGPPMQLKPVNVAQLGPDPEFFKLDAAKGGERWLVTTRFAWGDQAAREVSLDALGLNPDQTYLVFDFWKSKFLGQAGGKFSFDALKDGSCQTVSFRPLTSHPQVLGTDRHIGQGVYELENVKWDKNELSGTMQRGKGAQWSLYLHVPAGWELVGYPEGATVTTDGPVVRIKFAEGAMAVDWKAAFVRS